MGTFFAQALLAASDTPGRQQSVNLLVDGGSTYTCRVPSCERCR
jgi:hypothetical protein